MRAHVARRWAAPAVAAAVVSVAAVAPRAAAASAHPALPARSAAALLAGVERADVQALSGTVRTTANLGLPQLPDSVGRAAGSGWQALVTGTHQLRLWVDGAGRQRVALLGDLAETDLVHNGNTVWTYSSATNAVTQQTLTGPKTSDAPAHDSQTPEQQLTPQAQADKALKAIDPSTVVTVDRTARVAGRASYQLVLTPRTTATLVRSVRIAIDAATGVPLRVQIYAAGSTKPAFQTGFTTISFHRPAASVFRFTPPRGATVSRTVGTGTSDRTSPRQHEAKTAPTTRGQGWTTIVELPAGTVDLNGAASGGATGHGSTAALLNDVTAAVPQGRLLTTRLLTALITSDGRVLLGAVPPAAIEQAAGA